MSPKSLPNNKNNNNSQDQWFILCVVMENSGNTSPEFMITRHRFILAVTYVQFPQFQRQIKRLLQPKPGFPPMPISPFLPTTSSFQTPRQIQISCPGCTSHSFVHQRLLNIPMDSINHLLHIGFFGIQYIIANFIVLN